MRRASRWLPAGILAILLTGCGKAVAVDRCEKLLLSTLKAPASYKLVDQLVGQPERDGAQAVFLTYDAVNSYNAPLRDRFWCTYNTKTDTAKRGGESAERVADDLEAMADNLANEVPTEPRVSVPAKKGFDDEVPVCDQPDTPEKFALMNEIGIDCSGE